MLPIIAILLFAISSSSAEPIQAKRHTINLDLPPQERWVNISHEYKWFAPVLEKDMKAFFPSNLIPLLEKVALFADDHFPAPYPDEMRGVAKGLNVSFADVIMYNLVYELTAYCTSIVAQDKDGSIYHARNLDYSLSGDLRKVTFMADFQSKGKTVYTGVVFLGQVGLPTGQRPNAVTISIDERDKGSLIENLILALLDKKAMTIGFEVRNILATDNMDFNTAVTKLSQVTLIADIYFIVGGVKAGEGAVITRERMGAADVWRLDAPTRWFLVETNYDHWTTPPTRDDRRDPANKALTKLGQDKVNLMALFKVLSIKPVLNNGTIYTTVMQAKDGSEFNTWIRQP